MEGGIRGVAESRPGCPFGTEDDTRRAGGVLQRRGRRGESTLKPHPTGTNTEAYVHRRLPSCKSSVIKMGGWDTLIETGRDCTCRGFHRRTKELASCLHRLLKQRVWRKICTTSATQIGECSLDEDWTKLYLARAKPNRKGLATSA